MAGRTVSIIDVNGVKARVINVSKKIKTPTGAEVVRKAIVNLREFADFKDLADVYEPDQIFAFAKAGLIARARAIANGKVMNGGLDADGRALLRMFNETLTNFMEVMDLSKEDAIAKLMAPTKNGKDSKFKVLEDTIKALDTTEPTLLDYVTVTVPVPGDDDEDENEGGEPATE